MSERQECTVWLQKDMFLVTKKIVCEYVIPLKGRAGYRLKGITEPSYMVGTEVTLSGNVPFMCTKQIVSDSDDEPGE